jgi:hypothetical protein
VSEWAQGRTTVPRRVPYFIIEVGPTVTIYATDSCLYSHLLELTGCAKSRTTSTVTPKTDPFYLLRNEPS